MTSHSLFDKEIASAFGIHIIGDNLIVPVKGELDDDSVKHLQTEILQKAQATSVTGVLIDMSAVRVLDSFVFSVLADTARMVALLGCRPVFVGFQAGVASTLIDLNVDLENITAALTMEDGLELLRSLTPRWKGEREPQSGIVEEEDGCEGSESEAGDESDHEREL